MLKLTRLAGRADRPVIFDVGANEGQSIRQFRQTFPRPVLHSFEPGPDTFDRLKAEFGGTADVTLNPFALGAMVGELTFHENTKSDMSSFLQTGPAGWGEERRRIPARIETVDGYCARAGIGHIDVLKTDTQGFDLEVLRGAEGMLRTGAIHLIFTEIMMAELYRGLPGLDEIYHFLRARSFQLVSFYRFEYRGDRAGWTDALFAYTP
jgi:FkbM family methyltransferase